MLGIFQEIEIYSCPPEPKDVSTTQLWAFNHKSHPKLWLSQTDLKKLVHLQTERMSFVPCRSGCKGSRCWRARSYSQTKPPEHLSQSLSPDCLGRWKVSIYFLSILKQIKFEVDKKVGGLHLERFQTPFMEETIFSRGSNFKLPAYISTLNQLSDLNWLIWILKCQCYIYLRSFLTSRMAPLSFNSLYILLEL